MFRQQGAGRLTAGAVVIVALAGVGAGNALAALGDAASAPDAASVSYANGGQLTVRPGQSLNDVAIAVTQSHDKATLARATRALFDANPAAFMNHDPSRLRLGAVLTVPALDASGALAASGVAAASATAAPVSAPNVASNPAPANGAGSGVAQGNAAAQSPATGASAAAHAATPTASSVAAASSAAAGANSAAPGGVAASAPAGGSQATVLPASGTREWTGSVQPSASEPAVSASATVAGTTSAATAGQPSSQPRAQVSSLQQLLALKNRVLMELQKHGIGGKPPVVGTAPASGAQPAAGASSAAPLPGPVAAPRASMSNGAGLSQTELGVAAAIGAALVALLAALRMGRRKRERLAAQAASADEGELVSARATGPLDVASTGERLPAQNASDFDDDVAPGSAALTRNEALAAAEREAAEGEAAAREMTERAAAERDAESRRAAARELEEKAAAERAAAEQARAEQGAIERKAAEQAEADQAAADQAAADRAAVDQRAADQAADLAADQAAANQAAANQAVGTTESRVAPEALPTPHHGDGDGAITAASLAAAAELGAEALPVRPLEPTDEARPHEEPIHRPQWDDAQAAPLEASVGPEHHVNQPPLVDLSQPDVAPRETSAPEAAPAVERQVQAQSAPPTAPAEFPRDAVDAFGSLDMPLPPRVESSADTVQAPASLSTQPVASPETTAQQAAPFYGPHDDAPHVADEIAAGTAGHAAVAGLGAGLGARLGAAGFGALNLDFDLELPPSPAQPLPAFTQDDLRRIARNKLELAAEYIELGDLSGARSLINEVIETNDPGTRTEARALLSTLAPLS